jgi:hypothetical protein
LIAIIFISFKHGYVRDDWHEIIGTIGLLLASMLGLTIVWPVGRYYLRLAALLQLAFAFFLASSAFGSWLSNDDLPVLLTRTFAMPRLLAPVKMLSEPDYLMKAYQTNLADVRDRFPAPPLEGTVDIYPWNLAMLFAHGLRYQGRPVLQSYSAYTPELAELNAAWLRSSHAASNILFGIEPIDDSYPSRYPSLDDGLSWPELLTRYDIKGFNDAVGTYLLLSRSSAPGTYHLTLLQSVSVHWKETVDLPAATNAPIWAEVELKKTMVGTLASIFFKPPTLVLTVSLRSGERRDFRLVPAMARGGFLLSPLIETSQSFASLSSIGWPTHLIDQEVVSMTLSALTDTGSTTCYQLPIQLRFYRLDYPRRNFNQRDGDGDGRGKEN